MKKTTILLLLTGIFFYLTLSSYSSGPGTLALELTGVTGSASCGVSGCHGPTPTPSTTVSVQLLSGITPVSSYTPGSSYTIRVSGTQTSSSFTLARFGFQATCVEFGTSTNAGSFTDPPGCHTSVVGSVKVVEHSSALPATTGIGGPGTTYVVDIPWVAPTAGTGTVTLRAILNAVNFNAAADLGDKWNVATPVNITETTPSVAPITGTMSVCVGGSTTLSCATPGGTWSSSNPAIASIASMSGVVNGLTAGTVTITYTVGSTGSSTTTFTVNPPPPAILGTATVCAGSTTTLTNAVAGGTWSSGSTVVATIGASTGIVTGVGAGVANITYTLATGCSATRMVTVNPVPSGITGIASLCTGTTTSLFGAPSGGTWVSSTPSIATIGSSTGVVSGVSGGTATITYTLATGCFTTRMVTVDAAPTPPSIAGPTIVCVGTTITLTNASAGGTWSSSTTGNGTVGASSGIVTGVAVGPDTIEYSLTNSCGTGSVSHPITVLAASACLASVASAKDLHASLSIYPNPGKSSFMVNLQTARDEQALFIITDLTGKKVKEFTAQTNSTVSVRHGLDAGIYFISAITKDDRYAGKVSVE